METVTNISRTLILLLIIIMLSALVSGVRELTGAVILQRSTIESALTVAHERCQLDARMKSLEDHILACNSLGFNIEVKHDPK